MMIPREASKHKKGGVVDTEGEGDGLYPQKVHKYNVQCQNRVQEGCFMCVQHFENNNNTLLFVFDN